MRLSPHETQAIDASARETLWPVPRVGLFGTRADEPVRGGDIDLLVKPVVTTEAADEVERRQAQVARRF